MSKSSLIVLAALCVCSCAASAQEFVYDEEGARDPFAALIGADGRLHMVKKTGRAEEESADEKPQIEGIIYDKYGVSYAIINDSVVKTGDSVGDYIVLEIREDRVIFIREGQTTEVKFKKEEL